MIVVIDNYDSFTYNLVDLLTYLPEEILVFRNDSPLIEPYLAQRPTAVVVSPGPGKPENAGKSPQIVLTCIKQRIPVLGICLGHQLIAQLLGAQIILNKPFHGKTSTIRWNDNCELTAGISLPMTVMRYHSLVIAPNSLPSNLICIAKTTDDEIMAIRSQDKQLTGFQFHPESILTTQGNLLIENWYQTVNFYAPLRN